MNMPEKSISKSRKGGRRPEENHRPWIYGDGQYTQHLLCPGLEGRQGSNAAPALGQSTGWRERQAQRQRPPSGLGAGVEGSGAPGLAGQRKVPGASAG